MKTNILVLALATISFGAFAQTGLKDLKNKAEEAKSVDKDVTTAIKDKAESEVVSGAEAVSSNKLTEIKEKVAEKANVDVSTVDGAVDMAKNAISEKVAEKTASEKAVATEKIEENKAKREGELDAISSDPAKITEKNTELKAELEERTAAKGEKKASLLTKITTLGSKISAAEEKYTLLEQSGIAPEELTKKKAVIDEAKAKYSALTSSFN